MGIMSRLVRLCKADFHGVMDQVEDKGLILKQCLRDMEEEIGRKEAKLKKMMAGRDSAKREHEKYAGEIKQLEDDLDVAVKKDKDDIARFIIKKLKPLTCHRDDLGRHIETMEHELREAQSILEEQKLQYEQMKLKSAEYFRNAEKKEWEKTVSGLMQGIRTSEPSDEEIELELLRRKESISK